MSEKAALPRAGAPGWSSILGTLLLFPLPSPSTPDPCPEKPPFPHLSPTTLFLCLLPLAWEGQGVETLAPVTTTHPQLPWKRDSNPQGKGAEGLPITSPSTGCPRFPHTAACLLNNSPVPLSNLLSLLGSLREERVVLPYWGRPSTGKAGSLCPRGSERWLVARSPQGPDPCSPGIGSNSRREKNIRRH